MKVFLNQTRTFFKRKSNYITLSVFGGIFVLLSIVFTIMISIQSQPSTYVYTVFQILLIGIMILSIGTINIQLISNQFIDSWNDGIFEMELRKGVTKGRVLLDRLLFNIALTTLLIFVYIVLYSFFLGVGSGNKDLIFKSLVYGLFMAFIFDWMAKGILYLFSIFRKTKLIVTLGTIMTVLAFLSPFLALATSLFANVNSHESYKNSEIENTNEIVIAKEVLDMKKQYTDGIVANMLKEKENKKLYEFSIATGLYTEYIDNQKDDTQYNEDMKNIIDQFKINDKKIDLKEYEENSIMFSNFDISSNKVISNLKKSQKNIENNIDNKNLKEEFKKISNLAINYYNYIYSFDGETYKLQLKNSENSFSIFKVKGLSSQLESAVRSFKGNYNWKELNIKTNNYDAMLLSYMFLMTTSLETADNFVHRNDAGVADDSTKEVDIWNNGFQKEVRNFFKNPLQVWLDMEISGSTKSNVQNKFASIVNPTVKLGNVPGKGTYEIKVKPITNKSGDITLEYSEIEFKRDAYNYQLVYGVMISIGIILTITGFGLAYWRLIS